MPVSEDSNVFGEAIRYLFRASFVIQQIYEEYHEAVLDLSRKVPLTPQQIRLLLFLSKHRDVTVNELAQRMHRASPTIVLQLNPMEEQGYIVRERLAEDRRKVVIRLTEKSEELFEQLPSLKLEKLIRAMYELEKERLSRFRDCLKDFVEFSEELFPSLIEEGQRAFLKSHAEIIGENGQN